MRKRLKTVLALGLLLGMTMISTAQTSSAVPDELQGVHRIVCLGDSITQFGEGPGGYVWLVRHYLGALYPGMEVLNAGISGHKSNDMLERLQRDVIDKKPDLVTISCGVNDVWHGFQDNHPLGDGPGGIPLDVYKKNMSEIVTRIKASGARVVILASTLIYENLNSAENKKAEAYNAALRDIARREHAVYVDYQGVFRKLVTDYRDKTGGRDNLLTVDGVHMNGSGNEVMAHTLLTGLGVTPEAQASVQAQVAKEMRAKQE
jgi:acyl-CoA thioesterase-1